MESFSILKAHSFSPPLYTILTLPFPVVALPPICRKCSPLQNSESIYSLETSSPSLYLGLSHHTRPKSIVSAGRDSSYHNAPPEAVPVFGSIFILALTSVPVWQRKLNTSSESTTKCFLKISCQALSENTCSEIKPAHFSAFSSLWALISRSSIYTFPSCISSDPFGRRPFPASSTPGISRSSLTELMERSWVNLANARGQVHQAKVP